MASFTLYDLDPSFWQRVQLKARAEGATVKAVILRLLTAWLALVLVGISVGCGYQTPTQPAAVPFNEASATTLSLNGTAGTGTSGGTAVVIAKVQNGHGTNLGGIVVAFQTDVGSLSTASVTTVADGTATLLLTAATAANLTATIGTLTAHALVQSNPNVPTVPPIPDTPQPSAPDAPSPGPLTVTLLVTPGFTGTATTFSLQAPGISRAVWTFGDGAIVTTTAAHGSHVYTAAGTYTASVTITDTIGRTASNSQTFAIAELIPSYSVSLSASPASILVGASTTLTASVSPQNGAPPATSYAWTFGDGIASATAGPTTTHAYTTAGSFTARVTATGGTISGGASAVVTVTAVVPLFTMSGTGNIVFDMPTTVRRIHITGTYAGTVSNFFVDIGGKSVVIDTIGTSQTPPASDGIYLTTGGVVSITSSSGVAWSFTEVR